MVQAATQACRGYVVLGPAHGQNRTGGPRTVSVEMVLGRVQGSKRRSAWVPQSVTQLRTCAGEAGLAMNSNQITPNRQPKLLAATPHLDRSLQHHGAPIIALCAWPLPAPWPWPCAHQQQASRPTWLLLAAAVALFTSSEMVALDTVTLSWPARVPAFGERGG